MSLLASKKDKYGQVIKPGDIVVYRDRFMVYKKHSWGGPESKGLYGRFIGVDGESSVRYSSVLLAFDPLSKRRNQSEEVKLITRKYYESI